MVAQTDPQKPPENAPHDTPARLRYTPQHADPAHAPRTGRQPSDMGRVGAFRPPSETLAMHDTPAPLTVWCLYNTSHPRGYTARDRLQVYDTEAEAQAQLAAFEEAMATAPLQLRPWFWLAPVQCRARVWLLMYQECYEGAIVLGVYASRTDAETAQVSVLDNPYPWVGDAIHDPEAVFIEDDLLL